MDRGYSDTDELEHRHLCSKCHDTWICYDETCEEMLSATPHYGTNLDDPICRGEEVEFD
jgi:hypothetical protein